MASGYLTLVLAGDRGPDDPVARAAGVRRKVLAPIAGKPMICHVLESLEKVGGVSRIVILANQYNEIEEALRPYVAESKNLIEFAEGTNSPVASVRDFAIREAEFPLLIVTGDHPLLNSTEIESFLAAADNREADLFAGLTARSTVRSAFPECSRTFIRLGQEAYSGANLFLIKSPKGLNVVEFWTKLEKSRKKALKIASAFGWGNLFRVLLRLTNVDRAMDRVSRAVGATVCAVILEDPASAMDVDNEHHLAFAREILDK